jgi:hypothetical protein
LQVVQHLTTESRHRFRGDGAGSRIKVRIGE